MQIVIQQDNIIYHANISERDLTIVEGYSNGIKIDDIAKQLCLSPRTLELYLTKLRLRFNCHTTTHLVATFLRHGLIK